MSVAARFYVSEIRKTPTPTIGVTLLPVVRPEPLDDGLGNKSWAKYTPSGKIEMNVSTETGAAAWFESMLGKNVAITFDEA